MSTTYLLQQYLLGGLMHQTVFMNKHKSTNDYCFSTFESSYHHNLWILKTPFICLWFFLFSMNRKSKFLAKLFVVCILISDRREHFCADGMGYRKKRIEINLTLFICSQLWNMFSISDKKKTNTESTRMKCFLCLANSNWVAKTIIIHYFQMH